MGKRHEPDIEPLSKIIEVLKRALGMNLGEADQHFFDAFEELLVSGLSSPPRHARTRSRTFAMMFDRKFMNTIVTRIDDIEAIFKQLLDDDDFRRCLVTSTCERYTHDCSEGRTALMGRRRPR